MVDANEYRSHDFRRGHAQDMLENGATLCEILAAGQWRSPSFMKYLDATSLEKEAVVEANVDESSEDEAEVELDTATGTANKTEVANVPGENVAAGMPSLEASSVIDLEQPDFHRKLSGQKLLNCKRLVATMEITPTRENT